MKFIYCFLFVITSLTLAENKDSLWVEFSGDTINIWNSAELNCCSQIKFEAEINNNHITLTEVDTSESWCKCQCPFNLCASLPALRPGVYTVDLYRRFLIYYPYDSLIFAGTIQFEVPEKNTTTPYLPYEFSGILDLLKSFQSQCLNETEDNSIIYSNSFESIKDTIGWLGYLELYKEAAPGNGSYSAHVSGGCIWPHAWYILSPFNEDGYFILRCWAKDLGVGGIAGIMPGNDHFKQVRISVHGNEWKYYESSDTLFCPAGESITLFLGAGGIIASAMLVDKLEIVKINATSQTTGINENEQVLSFELNQNYPNPFNPSTKIKYFIPSENNKYLNNVELKVYDLLGNIIAILVDKQQSPGSYEVEFIAGNLSSGVYFYILKVDQITQYRKMVLIK